MSADEQADAIIRGLHEAGIEFIVVGGMAAVLQKAPVLTEDLDIVHRRTPENATRLLAWLNAHDAYHRFDLANRRLPPTEQVLLGHGHINLQTTLGKLDVLCELGEGEGYDEIFADTIELQSGPLPIRVLGLSRLIAVKARAGRPKDRAVLPVLLATLDEQRRSRNQ